MHTAGIICEYNPFHRGHEKQLRQVRELLGPDTGILCLMSGDFVQRGQPALYPKEVRAKAAVACGADVVLELPVQCCLSSAEGFAAGGVRILTKLGIVEYLAFGCETPEPVEQNLPILLSPEYQEVLREELSGGCSYGAAGQRALERMGGDGAVLASPNNILAVEYCRAIHRQGSPLKPLFLKREGSYHGEGPDMENPSAEYLRGAADWNGFVPEAALQCCRNQPMYRMEYGERAMLSRLRLLTQEDTLALPYSSEGLWNKLLRAIREGKSVEEILQAAKSKRYPYTRLSRMLLCACLGLTEEAMNREPEAVRVLALRESGRPLLRAAAKTSEIPIVHLGQPHPLTPSDLFYPLFREES